MTTLQELAEGPWRREYGSKHEMDPLAEDDALLEAQVLAVRFDALRNRVSVLFELRLALQLREGNTGLLVADGLTRFEWDAAPRQTTRTAWNVVGSLPRASADGFELRLGMLPQAELRLCAGSAAFYSGDVPGLLEIPDYEEAPDSELEAKLPQWGSNFSPCHAVFFGREVFGVEG